MTRYVLVDFERRVVEPEACASEQEAWRYACRLAREQDRAPTEWDIHAVEVEVVFR